MKQFNTAAVCVPSRHYMVDISARVAEIKEMVDAGKYIWTILACKRAICSASTSTRTKKRVCSGWRLRGKCSLKGRSKFPLATSYIK